MSEPSLAIRWSELGLEKLPGGIAVFRTMTMSCDGVFEANHIFSNYVSFRGLNWAESCKWIPQEGLTALKYIKTCSTNQ